MCDLISSQTVTTRKPHQCHGCTKVFPAKSKMLSVVGVDGGHMSRGYWCSECSKRSVLPGDEGECIDFGYFKIVDEEKADERALG